MANPFEKRATEYLRDDEAFLALVSPEPLSTYFVPFAKKERLLDQLVMIIGTPGSGKTTMGRLFQFSTIATALQNESLDSHRSLIAALSDCGAVKHRAPALLGTRVPLESEYREFWDFPYSDDLKLGLMTALIQARAVLGWVHELRSKGIELEDVGFVSRGAANAAREAIGGADPVAIYERAAEIERAVYRISAALVPPPVGEIPADAAAAYRPFDVIESITAKIDGKSVTMKPLIILDDAHTLHPDQFERTKRWLALREIRVARWLITRFDALTPRQVLMAPGLSGDREITYIRLQGENARAGERTTFRKMAKDISRRYLGRMDTFSRRNLTDLRALLGTKPDPIATSRLRRLESHINTVQKECGVSFSRRGSLEALIDDYFAGSGEDADVRLAMLEILMHRYRVRTRSRTAQLDLFDESSPESDVDPSKPIRVDAGVVDGARINLAHNYGRPYYYGIDVLCDAGTENTEQFLQLSSALVKHLETRLIRGRSVTLSPSDQDRLLRERAAEIVKEWDFPYASIVRDLVTRIAEECVAKSLEPNAPLKGGAIAIGIPMSEFETIPTAYPRLALILQFGVAYNAITLVQDHSAKSQKWCLLELGGAVLLREGLTLARGGFIERDLNHVLDLVSEGQNDNG